MASNGDRFISAYNKIDALLRKKVDKTKTHSFSSVVNEAALKDPTTRRYKGDLLEYGDLRNAIVHDLSKASVLLADPRDSVVQKIEEILKKLSHPKILRSLPHPFPLKIFAASTPLAESLIYMRTNKFSQVIAVRDEKYLILSTEGIVHWLEAKSKEDIIALADARLNEVLLFEPKDSCVYLKADDTVDAARAVFTQDVGKKIFSALVTEHGIAREKPINIVTPWDFVAGALQ